jgi:hypothetical protein
MRCAPMRPRRAVVQGGGWGVGIAEAGRPLLRDGHLWGCDPRRGARKREGAGRGAGKKTHRVEARRRWGGTDLCVSLSVSVSVSVSVSLPNPSHWGGGWAVPSGRVEDQAVQAPTLEA